MDSLLPRNWYAIVRIAAMPIKTISFDYDNTLTSCPTDRTGRVTSYTCHPNFENIRKLKEYKAMGYRILIVTARCEEYDEEENEWGPRGGMTVPQFVAEYNLPVDDIHYTCGEPKGPYLTNLGVDLHHDDQQHEIDSCNECGINVEHVGKKGGLR